MQAAADGKGETPLIALIEIENKILLSPSVFQSISIQGSPHQPTITRTLVIETFQVNPHSFLSRISCEAEYYA